MSHPIHERIARGGVGHTLLGRASMLGPIGPERMECVAVVCCAGSGGLDFDIEASADIGREAAVAYVRRMLEGVIDDDGYFDWERVTLSHRTEPSAYTIEGATTVATLALRVRWAFAV